METEKTKKPLNKWQTATFVFGLLSIVLGSMLVENNLNNKMKPEKAAQAAIDYINSNLLEEGSEATLVKIEDEEINKLYKFVLSVGGQEFASYVSADGKRLFASDSIKLDESIKKDAEVDGGFKESADTEEVCKESDKPVVYFFGSENCPHCVWEHPIIEEVASQFGDAIVFKSRVDSEEDQDVFFKYSPQGSIPAIVVGCKYYRVGSGEASGEEAEKENLKNIICKATNNQPSSICE